MRNVVSRMSKAANQRLDRIKRKGISTPATRQVEKSGGRFRAKGKDLDELRSEYKRVKSFLKSETSTISGYMKFAKRFEEKLNKIKEKSRKRQGKPPREGQETPLPMPEPEQEEQKQETEKDASQYFENYDKSFRIVERLKELNPWISENHSIESQVVAMVDEYVMFNPNTSIDDAVESMNSTLKAWYEAQTQRDNDIHWSKAF